MNKKTINIGDVFVTETNNLYGLRVESINSVKEVEKNLEDSEQYIYKSIFPEAIIKPLNTDYDSKMADCPIFIKYIGEGKFEEMETGTIILCQGSREMEEHDLVDDNALPFRPYKTYDSYQDLGQDILYIRENPIVLYNNEEGMIRPISEKDKREYMEYSKEDRIEIIEKLKYSALNKLNQSIEKQVDIDHEMANLENQIENFKRNK